MEDARSRAGLEPLSEEADDEEPITERAHQGCQIRCYTVTRRLAYSKPLLQDISSYGTFLQELEQELQVAWNGVGVGATTIGSL